MSLYNRLVKTPEGARALSSARLRYEVLRILHEALRKSGLTQVDLAQRMGIRKSAVNQVLRGDGNVRVSTLADYLHAMNFELELRLTSVGKPREDAVREMRDAWVKSRAVVHGASHRPVRRRSLEKLEWRDIASESHTEVPVGGRETRRIIEALLVRAALNDE